MLVETRQRDKICHTSTEDDSDRTVGSTTENSPDLFLDRQYISTGMLTNCILCASYNRRQELFKDHRNGYLNIH